MQPQPPSEAPKSPSYPKQYKRGKLVEAESFFHAEEKIRPVSARARRFTAAKNSSTATIQRDSNFSSEAKPKKNDVDALALLLRSVSGSQLTVPIEESEAHRRASLTALSTDSKQVSEETERPSSAIKSRFSLARQRSEALRSLTDGASANQEKREGFFYFH